MFLYSKEQILKEELEKAFRNLKSTHLCHGRQEASLQYLGNQKIRELCDRNLNDICALEEYIRLEEIKCENDLKRFCPLFYESTKNSRASSWMNYRNSREEHTAIERVRKAVTNIDNYAVGRSKELSGSLKGGVRRRFSNLPYYGFGRPWGTEIRQRLAVTAGLKQDVNSFKEVLLNSVANSRTVNLGSHFIELLKSDRGMHDLYQIIQKQIFRDMASNVSSDVPAEEVKLRTYTLQGKEIREFGGKSSDDNMIYQFLYTILFPLNSFSKYSDTWKVAFQELTWVLRHCTVEYLGTYHVVYNLYGYGFFWELEFSIEDILDLRPHSGKKLSFGNPYDIVTSILGSVYHDILGNTDKLKIHVKWNEWQTCQPDKVAAWKELYFNR